MIYISVKPELFLSSNSLHSNIFDLLLGDIVEKLEQRLGSIREVNGYIEVRESEALASLEFFKNLQFINPSKLLNDE